LKNYHNREDFWLRLEAALWVGPKTLWIARYLKRRSVPDFTGPKGVFWRRLSSVLIALQSFLFTHTLLVLIFIQWALGWDLP
jgi:hypothetical protein